MLKLISRFLLWLSGWKVNYANFEVSQKCVMIASPHTSNWDFYFMRLAFYVLDVPMKVTIKDDWTRFPFSLIIEPMGGIGIDRGPKIPGKKRKSYIDTMAELLANNERIAMIVTPEGTRSLNTKWKKGFYYAALKANVPICFGYLDYAKKEAGVGGFVHPTENIDETMRAVMAFYSTVTPKFPEKYGLDADYAPQKSGLS